MSCDPALPMHSRAGIMLLALLPGLIAIALFVGTLSLRPQRPRATLLPPQPQPRRC